MANINGFNAAEVDPNTTYDALPAGWYEAMIVESDMEPTKAGDGHFLKLKLQIIAGQFEGRTLFDRLNLDNPNEVAVQIAKGALSAICRSVKVLTPKDSTELHNLPLMVKVAQKPYEGEMRNEVKGYKSRDAAGGQAAAGTVAPTPGAAPAAAAAPAKPGAGNAPWLNKKAQ